MRQSSFRITILNYILSFLLIPFTYHTILSEDKIVKDDFKFNVLSYLSYQAELSNGELKNNQFMENRAYLTVKKNIFDWLGYRTTIDAYQDVNGNILVRFKYIYANFKFNDFGFFTKPNIEFGQVHTAWLDFEEHLNYYRMQGTMFMERAGLFNSADFGVTASTLLGGEMNDEYKKTVNKEYAGKFGSFALGIYNGGGYSAIESNKGKTIQTRLTIRPVAEILPGLQLSYHGIFGQGNIAKGDTVPDWVMNAGMLSFENQYFTFTGQFESGKGNFKGNFIDSKNEAIKNQGYSVFAEGKLSENFRVIGRYDHFDPNTDKDKDADNRVIIGLGYNFGNDNILLLDFDKRFFEDKSKADVNIAKLTMQVNI
ncbi:MAG: hypothetical protein EPN82_00775 [Bacteroidetes bacterium]|nr:MAG: hypothetical protein EPN82_00775 [Bacteroidota bacterium]